MDYKIFVDRTNEVIENMSAEELKNCLYEIIRKTTESKRNSFLQQLENRLYQEDIGRNNDKPKYKRLLTDEWVKERLKNIKKDFTKIEDNELLLWAQGYENYSSGYWSSEWIWEYEDGAGIGRIIENAIFFAYECVNDCRYEEAVTVFELVMDSVILAEDEHSGEFIELSLDEMADEGLIDIDLKKLALNALYSEYQFQPADKRAENMYLYFVFPYFQNVHIEDILPIGREGLKDTEIFFQSWIDFLMNKRGDTAARLLKEGILYYKGVEGSLEIARKGYKEHPSLYLATLQEYEKIHDYRNMKEVGSEALDKLDPNLKIRGEIAIKTAQASHCTDDIEFMRKCWYEAFHSNSTIPNYLRLFVDDEAMGEYKDIAEKRIKQLVILDRFSKKHISEHVENNISEINYKYLHFFSGHFEEIKDWCMEQKNPLGWSGKFIGHGIDLLLLYLYSSHKDGKAIDKVAANIANTIGFNDSNSLVFFEDSTVFESEVNVQKGKETFWKVFQLWKANYRMDAAYMNSFVGWLELEIDKRVDGIVGGQYRNRYGDVALLVAALGEVKESRGIEMGKSLLISKYMAKYPRHSAFRGALKEYMDF